jgi:hypothetical protein
MLLRAPLGHPAWARASDRPGRCISGDEEAEDPRHGVRVRGVARGWNLCPEARRATPTAPRRARDRRRTGWRYPSCADPVANDRRRGPPQQVDIPCWPRSTPRHSDGGRCRVTCSPSEVYRPSPGLVPRVRCQDPCSSRAGSPSIYRSGQTDTSRSSRRPGPTHSPVEAPGTGWAVCLPGGVLGYRAVRSYHAR